jgi:hypothetical protein
LKGSTSTNSLLNDLNKNHAVS